LERVYLSRWIVPEDIKPAEDIKKVERRLKSNEKKTVDEKKWLTK
jgi:DNA-damage-inducible protein D